MSDTISNSAGSGKLALLRRLALLALVVAVIGLPLNHLAGYTILLFLTVVVFVGEVTTRPRSWLAALALVLVALGVQLFLKPPRIDEGHNVFVIDLLNAKSTDDVLLNGLPPEVYRLMAAEFDKVHPPERRCDEKTVDCWRSRSVPERTFAFSADGIFDKGEFSRRVDDIDFSDPVWLRLGFSNERQYSWSMQSDVRRFRRDSRFWMGLHRWQFTMPYFVMYRFPAAFAGSELCWQGNVIWEERAERFTLLSNAAWACRVIEAGDAGRRIFGVGIRPGTLAMTLDPPPVIQVWQWTMTLFKLLVIASVVALLVRWRRRVTILPFTLIALSLLVVAVEDASFIGGFRPLDGGDDGLFHEGTGRNIVQYLLAGDFLRALEGGEPVYHFGGPGLRYFRALERIFFGDTNLGYLSLMLVLPFAVLALGRRFLSSYWALAFALIFVAIPVGVLFGTTFFLYSKWAARGFADPAAVTLALCGLIFLVGRDRWGPDANFTSACGAALLFAMAVFIRPNLAPFVGIMLAGAGLAALYFRQWTRVAGLCVGFLPVAVMPLHNWYFGGVFVLMSSNIANAELLLMPPKAWLTALVELLNSRLFRRGIATGGEPVRCLVVRSVRPAASDAGPRGGGRFACLHCRLGRMFDPWLRLVALAALAQHGVALFYAGVPRYYFVAWLVTSLIVAVWFEQRGIEILRRRWPEFFERLRQQPLSRALSRGLSELERSSTTGQAR